MVRKNMKSALANSLQAEDEAVKSRFEKAESLFGDRSSDIPKTDLSQEASQSPPPPPKAKKPKVIRDSFTIPNDDYELISETRQRCLQSAVNVTKSEVIRAGLHALQQLNDEELVQVFGGLEKIKTGRPSKTK